MFWEDLCSHLTHPDNRDVLLKHYGDWLQYVERPAMPLQLPDGAQHITGGEDWGFVNDELTGRGGGSGHSLGGRND